MNFFPFIFCAKILLCNLTRKVITWLKCVILSPLYFLYVFSDINISNALWYQGFVFHGQLG